jgi:hypothetical protein
MTLTVLFHQLRYRQLKRFCLSYALRFLRSEFPRLPSYHRYVELMPRCAVLLSALFAQLKGRCTGITILDSRPLAVGDNLRIPRHRVFASVAARGKSSTGWFYGSWLQASDGAHHVKRTLSCDKAKKKPRRAILVVFLFPLPEARSYCMLMMQN